MRNICIVGSLALVVLTSGCTSSYRMTSEAPAQEAPQVAATTTEVKPVESYAEKWAKLKSNISVDINCDNYAYTGQTTAKVTNNNAENLEVSISVAYLHSDGSVAGKVWAEYVDLAAGTTTRVLFSDPTNGFSYSTCKVWEIRDESLGND